MKQILTLGFEFKSVIEGSGLFEGYASTFNNIDLGYDKVMPGAFKKTIKENKGKFPVLSAHDMREQIGFNLEATEDDHGLYVKGELLVNDIAKAREHYALAKKAVEIKAKSGLSIGYQAIKWDMDNDVVKGPFRKLKELKLMEYSFVAFPMNTESMVTAVKKWDGWIKLIGAKENEVIENFVASLKEEGFNELNIKSALVTAAAKIGDPIPKVDLDQLFDEASKKFKNL